MNSTEIIILSTITGGCTLCLVLVVFFAISSVCLLVHKKKSQPMELPVERKKSFYIHREEVINNEMISRKRLSERLAIELKNIFVKNGVGLTDLERIEIEKMDKENLEKAREIIRTIRNNQN